jgi:hypothetical protein
MGGEFERAAMLLVRPRPAGSPGLWEAKRRTRVSCVLELQGWSFTLAYIPKYGCRFVRVPEFNAGWCLYQVTGRRMVRAGLWFCLRRACCRCCRCGGGLFRSNTLPQKGLETSESIVEFVVVPASRPPGRSRSRQLALTSALERV